MAKYTFSAESDDLHEIATLVTRMTHGAPAEEPEVAPAVEAETAAAKPRQSRKAKEPEAQKAPETTAAATEEPAADVTLADVTLADVKSKASELLNKGGDIGKQITEKLKADFGVGSFGALSADQYASCLAMLEEL